MLSVVGRGWHLPSVVGVDAGGKGVLLQLLGCGLKEYNLGGREIREY